MAGRGSGLLDVVHTDLEVLECQDTVGVSLTGCDGGCSSAELGDLLVVGGDLGQVLPALVGGQVKALNALDLKRSAFQCSSQTFGVLALQAVAFLARLVVGELVDGQRGLLVLVNGARVLRGVWGSRSGRLLGATALVCILSNGSADARTGDHEARCNCCNERLLELVHISSFRQSPVSLIAPVSVWSRWRR